jgi:L-gulonolactone oxidase
VHTPGTGRLRALYPRYDDFRRVRADVDPEARFGNPYLTQVLGNPGDKQAAGQPESASWPV